MGARSLAKRITCGALLGAPLLWPALGVAAPPAGFAPPIHETQFMLYVSKPIASSTRRSWGLRIDQASAPPLLVNSMALGPLHRRELLNLMITPQHRAQIEIGRRLTWDLSGKRLSLERD